MTADAIFDSYLLSICDNQAQYEAVKEIHEEYFPEKIDDEVDLENIKDEDYEFNALKTVFDELQEQDDDGEIKIEFEDGVTFPLTADWDNDEFVVEIDQVDEDGNNVVYTEKFNTFYKDEDGEDVGLSEEDIIKAAIDFFGELIADEYPEQYEYVLKVDKEDSEDEECKCEDGECKCDDGECDCKDGECDCKKKSDKKVLDESVLANKLAADAAHYGLDLSEYVDAIELFKKKFSNEEIQEVYDACN